MKTEYETILDICKQRFPVGARVRTLHCINSPHDTEVISFAASGNIVGNVIWFEGAPRDLRVWHHRHGYAELLSLPEDYSVPVEEMIDGQHYFIECKNGFKFTMQFGRIKDGRVFQKNTLKDGDPVYTFVSSIFLVRPALTSEIKNYFPDKEEPAEKPPIVPKSEWQEQRRDNLIKAISRYLESKNPIPAEWVEEYNELIRVLK